MHNAIIYHITTPNHWQTFVDEKYFESNSLQSEGFIHASTAQQLQATAQRYYAQEKEILILHLDANAMLDKIKYELSASVNDYFPHIFGSIEKHNIIKIQTVKNENGHFAITV